MSVLLCMIRPTQLLGAALHYLEPMFPLPIRSIFRSPGLTGVYDCLQIVCPMSEPTDHLLQTSLCRGPLPPLPIAKDIREFVMPPASPKCWALGSHAPEQQLGIVLVPGHPKEP